MKVLTADTASTAIGSIHVTDKDVVPWGTVRRMSDGQPLTTGGISSGPAVGFKMNQNFDLLGVEENKN